MHKGLIFGFRLHSILLKLAKSVHNGLLIFLQSNPNCTEEDELNFHHFGGKGDIRNDIKMNQENKLKTLSVTQFIMSIF